MYIYMGMGQINMIRALPLLLVFILLVGCASVQNVRLPFSPISCETKGLCAIYTHAKDAKEVFDLFARKETTTAVATTTKLALNGKAKPLVNEKVTIVEIIDANIVRVKLYNKEEGYMMRVSLDCRGG